MSPNRTLRAQDLVSAGLVETGRTEEIRRVAKEFAVALTADVAALIDRVDPMDPIAAQFVPSGAELEIADEERADPIGTRAGHRCPGSSIAIPIGCC